MLRHVAVFTWKAGTTRAEVDDLEVALAALPGQIAEIRDYRFGSDLGLREGNAHFAVVGDFDDAEGYRRYAGHPAHQEVIRAHIQPMAESRTSLQFNC